MARLIFFLCFAASLDSLDWCSAASSDNNSAAMLSAACSLSLIASLWLSLRVRFCALVLFLACRSTQVFSAFRPPYNCTAAWFLERQKNPELKLQPSVWLLIVQQSGRTWKSYTVCVLIRLASSTKAGAWLRLAKTEDSIHRAILLPMMMPRSLNLSHTWALANSTNSCDASSTKLEL